VTRAAAGSGRGLTGAARRIGGLLLAIVAAEDRRLRGTIARAVQAHGMGRRLHCRQQSLLEFITNARTG
jgi:hypothetical protein